MAEERGFTVDMEQYEESKKRAQVKNGKRNTLDACYLKHPREIKNSLR
jgi:hypothetical protein